MQFKQTLVRVSFLLLPYSVTAQTTYLEQDAKENIVLERLEIKLKTDTLLNFSKNKPFSRKSYNPEAIRLDSSMKLSDVDHYNLSQLIENSQEWGTVDNRRFKSKKPWGRHFYLDEANFYMVKSKDFFLTINPVLQFMAGKETNNQELLFLNSRGLTIRGRIADKIGFYTFLTDNQERDPLYVQNWVSRMAAVPGEGYYKKFKGTGYDYFDARGYFTFNIAKFIDASFGYDKNFIGNGIRSLYLSDFSNNALFFKLNTRIWKLNYENLFMQLTATEPRGPDRLLGQKYATIHHIDVGITKALNIGVFEAIIFDRKDHFDFGYLNPVIFYRSIEQQNGSPDNALAGIDAKINVAGKFQFYGQLLIDEFKLSEIKANRGWWGNKYGIQLGAKYIDAFNISNLDLQLEMNRVRPFTYSHDDSLSNYAHYNQPLAHPLGANFQEMIGMARYQPVPRWNMEAKIIYYYQGRDTANSNFGSNIFLPDIFPYRTMDYGFKVGSGIKINTFYASLFLSYEFRHNLFIEGNAIYRKQSANILVGTDPNEMIFSAGIRWNMNRRKFEF